MGAGVDVGAGPAGEEKDEPGAAPGRSIQAANNNKHKKAPKEKVVFLMILLRRWQSQQKGKEML
jgi:hypothetical protein